MGEVVLAKKKLCVKRAIKTYIYIYCILYKKLKETYISWRTYPKMRQGPGVARLGMGFWGE